MEQTTLTITNCPKLSQPENACIPFCELMGGSECHKYGGPLPGECPGCGYVNISSVVVCWRCGASIGHPRVQRLAEAQQ